MGGKHTPWASSSMRPSGQGSTTVTDRNWTQQQGVQRSRLDGLWLKWIHKKKSLVQICTVVDDRNTGSSQLESHQLGNCTPLPQTVVSRVSLCGSPTLHWPVYVYSGKKRKWWPSNEITTHELIVKMMPQLHRSTFTAPLPCCQFGLSCLGRACHHQKWMRVAVQRSWTHLLTGLWRHTYNLQSLCRTCSHLKFKVRSQNVNKFKCGSHPRWPHRDRLDRKHDLDPRGVSPFSATNLKLKSRSENFYTKQILFSFCSDKDRRTDSRIRRKNTRKKVEVKVEHAVPVVAS